jgi:flavin reductase (DIM6/NTAB) family NADH-FMN oxidoreductase RutF
MEDDGADAFDRLRRRVLWAMPYGLYVVGSRAGDRRNGMTINFVTQLATEPKLVGISVQKHALTHRLLEEGRVFALNVIAREDKAIVRKFVKPVDVAMAPGASTGTMSGFPFHEGKTGSPILDQAVAVIECRVTQTVDCGDHTLFIGEVADACFQQPEDTAVLRMEDTRMNYGG